MIEFNIKTDFMTIMTLEKQCIAGPLSKKQKIGSYNTLAFVVVLKDQTLPV